MIDFFWWVLMIWVLSVATLWFGFVAWLRLDVRRRKIESADKNDPARPMAVTMPDGQEIPDWMEAVLEQKARKTDR